MYQTRTPWPTDQHLPDQVLEDHLISTVHHSRNDQHFAEFLFEIFLYEIAGSMPTSRTSTVVRFETLQFSAHMARSFMMSYGHDPGLTKQQQMEQPTPMYDLFVATAPYAPTPQDVYLYLKDEWRVSRLFLREVGMDRTKTIPSQFPLSCTVPRLSQQDHEHFQRQYARIKPEFQDRYAAIVHGCRKYVWQHQGTGGISVMMNGLWGVEKYTSKYNAELRKKWANGGEGTATREAGSSTANGEDSTAGAEKSKATSKSAKKKAKKKTAATNLENASVTSVDAETSPDAPPIASTATNNTLATSATSTSTSMAAAAATATATISASALAARSISGSPPPRPPSPRLEDVESNLYDAIEVRSRLIAKIQKVAEGDEDEHCEVETMMHEYALQHSIAMGSVINWFNSMEVKRQAAVEKARQRAVAACKRREEEEAQKEIRIKRAIRRSMEINMALVGIQKAVTKARSKIRSEAMALAKKKEKQATKKMRKVKMLTVEEALEELEVELLVQRHMMNLKPEASVDYQLSKARMKTYKDAHSANTGEISALGILDEFLLQLAQRIYVQRSSESTRMISDDSVMWITLIHKRARDQVIDMLDAPESELGTILFKLLGRMLANGAIASQHEEELHKFLELMVMQRLPRPDSPSSESIQEATSQKPIPKEPIVREPIVREPIVREPVVREPIVREPIVREPKVREPKVRETIVKKVTLTEASKKPSTASHSTSNMAKPGVSNGTSASATASASASASKSTSRPHKSYGKEYWPDTGIDELRPHHLDGLWDPIWYSDEDDDDYLYSDYEGEYECDDDCNCPTCEDERALYSKDWKIAKNGELSDDAKDVEGDDVSVAESLSDKEVNAEDELPFGETFEDAEKARVAMVEADLERLLLKSALAGAFERHSPEQEAGFKQREEAERQANMKEAERVAKEETERVAKAQAEEAERIAKTRAEEAARLVRMEAKRVAKVKADEAARVARVAERLAKVQAEEAARAARVAERVAKVQAEEAARVAREAERVAKEKSDQAAKDEAERIAAAALFREARLVEALRVAKAERQADLISITDIATEAQRKLDAAVRAKSEADKKQANYTVALTQTIIDAGASSSSIPEEHLKMSLDYQAFVERSKADKAQEVLAMRRQEKDADNYDGANSANTLSTVATRPSIPEGVSEEELHRLARDVEAAREARDEAESTRLVMLYKVNAAAAISEYEAKVNLEKVMKEKKQEAQEKAKLKQEAEKEAARLKKEAEKEAVRLRKEAEKEAARLKKEAEKEAARLKQEAEKEAVRLKQEAEKETAAIAKLGPVRQPNNGAVYFDWQGLNLTLSLWQAPIEHMQSMEAFVHSWYMQLLPSQESSNTRQELLQRLQMMFDEEYPGQGLQLRPFGSCITGLGNDWSDLDICIYSDNYQSYAAHFNVVYIAEFLRKRKMQKVVAITDAKVPIIKFVDPSTNVACDMNVQHSLGIHNSQLIRAYLDIDPRLGKFLYVLKYFAKCHGILDGSAGFLCSYAYILMGIVFFQEQNEAILPRLQSRSEKPRSYTEHRKHRKRMLTFAQCAKDGSVPTVYVNQDDKVYDCSFDTRTNLYKSYGLLNKKSVAQLLFEFFEFFSRKFDYRTMEVSAPSGKIQERHSLSKEKRQQQIQAKMLGGIEAARQLSQSNNGGLSYLYDSKRQLWLSAAEQAYFADLDAHGGLPSGAVPMPGSSLTSASSTSTVTTTSANTTANKTNGRYQDRFGSEAFLCVMDPFIFNRNVAGTCRGEKLAKVWRCFDHAYKCLGQGRFEDAFQPQE